MGLIPTRAGTMELQDIVDHATEAHPHSRGDHMESGAAGMRSRGSSPRIRGTRCGCVGTLKSTRPIHTHAGNTLTALSSSCRERAHSRTHGEHQKKMQTGSSLTGSFPHTRGQRSWFWCLLGRKWLIPAHAGIIAPEHRVHPHRAAHSRTLGEH